MRGGAIGVVLAAVAVALALSGEAQAAVTCDGKPVTIKGSNGDNVIKGTKKKDVIAGRGGADTIKARGGDDTVCGGDGPDNLLGAAGDDRLLDDSPEADTLTGGDGVDICTQAPEDVVECDFGTEDPVVFAPFNKPAKPASFDVTAATELQSVDIYAILDRSGSMNQEVTAIRDNLALVVDGLQCEPFGTGTPGQCIPDLWAGAGTVGYAGGGATAFQNFVDLQPNPNFAGVPTTEPTGCCNEPLTYSVHATITGAGGASFDMASVPARATCTGSPANNGGFSPFGYPCFRTGALPVVVLATDETPLSGTSTHQNPNWANTVRPAMNNAGGRFVGVLGSGALAAVGTELRQMATDTGAVDATNGNAPLVFDGAGANAPTALSNGIRALIQGLPLNVSAEARDDTSDSVDAVTSFIDHVDVLPSGSPECSASYSSIDTDADSFEDEYVGVPPGTPLCWKVVAKQNQTVPATTEPQAFRVVIDVYSDGRYPVDEHEVYFVVPPTR
jgi:hypothetical protein